MAIPSKVREIGEAAEQAATDAGLKPGQPTVQPQEKPAIAAVDPAPRKVDPEDYKERFSRYKASTDQTINELRNTLTQTQSAMAEAQTQNTQLMQQVQELMMKVNQQPAATPAVPANPADDPAFKKWLKSLPEHITTEYEESYLLDQYLIQKAANQSFQSKPDTGNEKIKELEGKVDNLSQYQQKTAAQLYDEELDSAFPNDAWIQMTGEPEWATFCAKTVSPVDQRTYGEIVKQGNEGFHAPTVIWVLNEYKQSLEATPNATPPNPLEGLVSPGDAAGGSGADPITELKGKTESFTVSQVNQFFKDVATTKKYTAEQASDIEGRIKAAQAAGNILPG